MQYLKLIYIFAAKCCTSVVQQKCDNMTTFKGMIFPHHRRENGTIPAKIRITHNRATKYIPTSIIFYPDQYTRTFNMKNCSPKFQLDELVRTYTERLSKIRNLKETEIDTVIKIVTTEITSGAIDFIKFWESELENFDNKGSRRNYNTALNNLKEYCPVLTTDEIDYNFLVKYAKHILQNNGERACSLYLGSFRHIFFKARDTYNDEEVGQIRIPRNPFKKFIVPKQKKSENRALSIESVKIIQNLPDGGLRWNLARDMYMFSFYAMGMNSVDMYRCSKSKNDRIIYERSKTKDRRDDNALMVLYVQPEMLQILEKYKDKDRLFNFHRRYAGAEEFNTAINKGLKQIEKHLRDEFDKKIEKKEIPEDSDFNFENLEFYSARHTWATFAQNKCGVDKYTVHECLNHITPETKITDIYIEKDWSRINDANRIVLDKFNE